LLILRPCSVHMPNTAQRKERNRTILIESSCIMQGSIAITLCTAMKWHRNRYPSLISYRCPFDHAVEPKVDRSHARIGFGSYPIHVLDFPISVLISLELGQCLRLLLAKILTGLTLHRRAPSDPPAGPNEVFMQERNKNCLCT
jgi:hypothetical protein